MLYTVLMVLESGDPSSLMFDAIFSKFVYNFSLATGVQAISLELRP